MGDLQSPFMFEHMPLWGTIGGLARGRARELIHVGGHALVSKLQGVAKEEPSCPVEAPIEPIDYRLISELCGRRDGPPWEIVAVLLIIVLVLGLVLGGSWKGPREGAL